MIAECLKTIALLSTKIWEQLWFRVSIIPFLYMHNVCRLLLAEDSFFQYIYLDSLVLKYVTIMLMYWNPSCSTKQRFMTISFFHIASTGFLGVVIQNSKWCGQALHPFFFSYFLSLQKAYSQVTEADTASSLNIAFIDWLSDWSIDLQIYFFCTSMQEK